MRTLNKTIKDMAIIYNQDCSICKHTFSCNQKESGCVEKNALYYLKKFQELKEQEREKEEKFNKLFKETYLSFPDFMDLIMN